MKVVLGDLVEVITKGTTPTTLGKSFTESGISFVKVESIGGGGQLVPDKLAHIDQETHALLGRSQLREGDILFSIAGVIGRTLIVTPSLLPANTNQALAIIRPKSSLVDGKFLYYYLSSKNFNDYSLGRVVQTAQANVSLGELKKAPVHLPPPSNQRKIAAILSAYDDLIENNNCRIKLLEEMAQRIYREWFVDFRYPGHQGVPLVDSELGLIPEGWVVGSLQNVIDFDIGGGWGADEVSISHDHFAWVIRGTDIPRVRRGDVSSCPGRYHAASNLRSRLLRIGDIVFEVSGGSKGQPVGRSMLISPVLLEEMKSDVICASFCKLIRPNREILSPEILSLRFLDAYENGEIGTYQVQSTGITNLRFSQLLESFPVVVPLKAIQAKFVNYVGTLASSVHLLGVQNRNLRFTRDLLLPRLISGEIDVSDLDIALPEAAA